MARIQKPEAKRGQVQSEHVGAGGRILSVHNGGLSRSPGDGAPALWQPKAGGQVGGEAAVRVGREFLDEVKAAINRDYRHWVLRLEW